MATTPDNISKLYNAFSAKYDNFKSEEEFRNYVNTADAQKMQKLYDAFSAEYDNFGSVDELKTYVGWHPGEVGALGEESNNGAKGVETHKQRQEQAAATTSATKHQPQVAAPKQTGSPSSTAPQKPWKPSPIQMMHFHRQIAQGQQAMRQQVAGFNQRMENMQTSFHQLGMPKIEFNPQSSKVEQMFYTPAGNKYNNQGTAQRETAAFNEAFDQSVPGQLRRARNRLNKLRGKLNSSASRVHDEWAEDYEKNDAPLAAVLASQTYVPRQQSDPENSAIRVAIRQTEELIRDLEEQQDRDNGKSVGFWRGFGRAVSDFRTWDFGQSDLLDAFTMLNASRYQSPDATEGERSAYQDMLESIYNKQQTEQRYGQEWHALNNWGKMTGMMLPFMVDFALTGGGYSGVEAASKVGTKAATKAATKLGMNATGKSMLKMMSERGVKQGARQWMQHEAVPWAIKAIGTTADDLLIRAPLMTNTVQGAKTASDVIDRKLGDVVVGENGDLQFSNDKSYGDAIWQAEANSIIENYSEMFGTHLPAGALADVANVFGAKRLSAALTKAGNSVFGQIYKGTNDFMKRLGVSDYFGEVSEEYYGQLWRTALNLDDAYKLNPDGTRTNLFATGQFHGDIWGGMALSIGLIGAGKMTASGTRYIPTGVEYLKLKHVVRSADNHAASIWGDEWESMRNSIDGTTNEDMGQFAQTIINDTSLNDQEKESALNYMERSLNLRGFNLGKIAQSRNDDGSPVLTDSEDVNLDNELSQSFMLGHDQAYTNKHIVRRLRHAVETIGGTMGDESFYDIWLNGMSPASKIAQMREEGATQDEIDAAYEYLYAKNEYDGVMKRIEEDRELDIQRSRDFYNRATNANGNLHELTLKNDDRVYLTSGNVVMMDDGTMADQAASDNFITVYNPQTDKIESISAGDVLSLGYSMTPDEIEAAIENSANVYTDCLLGLVNGRVHLTEGAQVWVKDEKGEPIEATVVRYEPTDHKWIISYPDGSQIGVTEQELQEVADYVGDLEFADLNNERKTQLAESRAMADEIEKDEVAEENPEQPSRQFNLNDELYLCAENGEIVHATITEPLNDDGLIEVQSDSPIIGSSQVVLLTPDELNDMIADDITIESDNDFDASESENSGTPSVQLPTGHTEIRKFNVMQPLGRAVMKFEDRPVEVMSGRVVMMDDGSMVDKEKSDATIIIRDLATGKTEMCSPEDILSYEDYAPATMPEDAGAEPDVAAPKQKYGTGVITIRNSDGSTTQGYLTGRINENGEYEYVTEGNNLHYASESVLDNIVADYQPDQGAEPIVAKDSQGKELAVGDEVVLSAGRRGVVQELHPDGRVTVNHDGDIITYDEAFGDITNVGLRKVEAPAPAPTEPQGEVSQPVEQPLNTVPEQPQNVPTPTPLQRVPKDESGQPIFEAADHETAWDALVEYSEGDAVTAKEIADAMVEEKKKALDKAQKLKLKGKTPAEMLASKKTNAAELSKAQQEFEQWQRIAGVEQERTSAMEAEAEAKRKAEAEAEAAWEREKRKLDKEMRELAEESRDFPEILDVLRDDEPHDMYEIASLALCEYKVLWGDKRGFTGSVLKKGLSGETGYGEAERRKFVGLFASEAKGGKSLQWIAEDAMESLCLEYGVPYDNSEAYNALLDVLGSSMTRGDIRHYIRNNRMATAREMLNHIKEQMEEFAEEDFYEHYHMSREEYGLYEEKLMEDMAKKCENFDIDEFYGNIADEIAKIEENGNREHWTNESEGEVSTDVGGVEVLPASWVDKRGGDTPDGGESSVSGGVGDALHSEDGGVQAGTSGGINSEGGGKSSAQPLVAERAAAVTGQGLQQSVETASAAVDTNPTDAQKEAGNYKKGHVKVGDFDITIENPAGSVRSGTDANGRKWETTMANAYGYIKGTESVDGDHIDVFLAGDMDAWNGQKVFVVDQTKPNGTFDEHKVMLGFNDKDEAYNAYLANYDKDWAQTHPGIRVSEANIEDFNKWIQSSHRKTKPFADYSTVSKITDNAPAQSENAEGKRFSAKESSSLIERMASSAETARDLTLTPESWEAEFGERGIVRTPIGEVKMGEHQYLKLMKNNREGYFGMVKPTLERPDIILEEYDPKEGADRDTKLLFVKTFKKADGSRVVHFESVTVQRDNKEVSISSHELQVESLNKKMQHDNVLHLDGKFLSSEGRLTEPQIEGPDLVPTPNFVSSGDKGSEFVGDKQGKGGKSSAPKEVEKGEGYAIVSKPYTNKQGKTLDTYLVTFDRDFSREEMSALRAKAKEVKGWYDRETKGWMLRSAEDAKAFAEGVVSKSEDEVADEAPLSVKGDIEPEIGTVDTMAMMAAIKAGFTVTPRDFTTNMPPTPKRKAIGLVSALLKSKSLAELQKTLSDNGYPMELADALMRGKELYKDGSTTINELADMVATLFEGDNSPKAVKKGETKVDKPAEAKEQPKPKKRNKWISDEDAAEYGELMDDLRRELGGGGDIVEEEGAGYGNKPQVKPMNAEVLRKGTAVTYMMMKGGLRKFSDYCEAMVDELGDAIRPHLKPLYAFAQNLEEVIAAGWDEEMDDRKTVLAFDVYNFDKQGAVDLIETAQHVVDEQASAQDVANIINQLKDKRNERRRKEADKTSASTKTIVDEAEAAASEVENQLKDAADEETAEGLAGRIDKSIEKVNEQLALLGYYEADPVESDYNEAYGYMRNAERKATQDAHKLATQIASDLGLTIDTKDKVKKGKSHNFGSKLVQSNIAPAGGEVNVRIPLNEERDLYVRIALDPVEGDMSKLPYRQSDDLRVSGIMYRVEGKGVSAMNNFAAPETTYDELLADIKRIVRHYLPEEKVAGNAPVELQPGEDIVAMAERVSNSSKPKEQSVKPEQTMGGLFDNILGEREDAESEMETVFVEEVSKRLGREKMNITTLRKIARDVGLEGRIDTDLQELTELAIVNRAREIAKNAPTLRDGFNQIVELYKTQPTISQRSSERVAKQQYSTPIPLGYMADAFINAIRPKRVLEPSGGNGMMIHAIEPGTVHANDIDKMRLKNLRRQGFAKVTDQDGRESFKQRHYDAIVTNPPFGQAKVVDYDGFPISGLEKQMSINALNSMRDDGRAAIIIGGNTEYDEKGRIKGADRIFFNYLYSRYNVVDVINVSGEMYSRQGTSYPVRMILIDGRRPYPAQEYAPRRADARAERVTTFDELFNRINDELLRSEELSKAYGDSRGEQGGRSISEGGDSRADDTSRPDTSVSDNDRERRESETRIGGHSAEHDNGTRPAADGARRPGGRGESVDGSAATKRPGRSASAEREATGRAADTSDGGNDGRDRGRSANATNVVVGAGGGTGRVTDSKRLAEIDVERQQRNEDKARRESNVRRTLDENPDVGAVEYISQSSAREIGSTVPANQAQPISKALKRIGDVDEFLRQQLGYADMGQLYAALSAEQIDSVALAITQMANSKGFIIGDMTGVGKGRQAAAIIRWAVKAGHKPIFMTEKANLFSDIYRDLTDIGSGELRPLIINAGKEADITDSNGEVVHRAPRSGDKALKRILESGKIPDGYDFVIMTYSQLNAKDMNAKKTFFMKIAAGNYLVMDESHNAGGDGNTGTFLQNILSGGENTEGRPVRGVTFLSGTFAKRPDNMPIYALKTDIGNSGLTAEEMIQTIIEGGVPLQEIMSRALASSGQMVRRERDFTGVTVDWTTIGNRAEHERQERQYDSTIGLFNRIIQFQEKYVTPIIEMMDAEIAGQGKEAGGKKGTKKGGVDNQPLFSKTFLVTRQLMFAMKADAVADMVIEQLKQGKKPVVAVDNTMESFADNHLPNTGEFDMPTIAMSYEGHLESCMQYTVKDAQGHESHSRLHPGQLSPEGRAEYDKIIEEIHNATDGVFLSPIDRIKSRVRAAGYSVAELTGRKYEIQETSEGRYSKISRTDTDKKKSARDFNNGEVDVLILNKSASTGISLHSSKQFGDQRQRVMIIAQPQLDVNTEVQMRGRIDRTGQIWRGHYIYAMCSIPAESRLIMMLKAKLKSLDANTKSSQKSEVSDDSIVDFLNKYGDEICLEYLKEHRELADELYDPLHFDGKEDGEIDAMTAAEGTASKICGRVALLSSARQREFYDEIGRLFTEKINYLNEIGENELVISSLPLAAETKATRVFQHGKDPGKGNEFAEDSIMEECEVNVLRKPLKMAEIQREQERLTGGYTDSDEYKRHLHSVMEEHKAAEIALLNERLSKKLADAKARKDASIRKEAEKLAKKSGREIDEAEVSAVSAEAIATVEKEQAEKADKMLNALNNRYEAIHGQINSIQYFDTCAVPNKIGIASSGSVYAYVIGVKIPKTGSKLTLVCATLDGRRKVEIPFSDAWSMNNVYQSKYSKRLDPAFPTASTWDKSAPTATRETMYIATGNLLQAYPRMAQGSKIVNFTDKDGNIRQGIIMPKWAQADAGKLMTNTIEPFENIGEAVAEGKKTFSDTHDEVTLGWNQREWAYELVVPKSKTSGGKYYLDEGLKSLLEWGGNFQQRRNTFVAVVKRENVAKVAKYLSDKFKLKAYVPIDGEASAREPGAEYLRERREMANFASRYETQDGKTISYTSGNPEAYGVSEAGAEYGGGDSGARRRGVQRKNGALLASQHDQLGEGEYSHIERIFRESDSFEFTSGEKVRSAADVAYIFDRLEDSSVENAFVVLVKGGRPTVLHLSMGTFTATMVNVPAVKEAYRRIGPDAVYFVHNHPSGELKCSVEDVRSLENLERSLGVRVFGLIMDRRSGAYGTFDGIWGSETHATGARKAVERRLRLYAFDRQVFTGGYDPRTALEAPMSAEEVAKYLSSHRLGARGKISYLIRAHNGGITANIHSPYTEISDANMREMADDIIRHITNFGGTSAFIYGDYDYSGGDTDLYRALNKAVRERSGGSYQIVDAVRVGGLRTWSAQELGLMEPGAEYGSTNVKRYRMGDSPQSFEARLRQAIANRGTVMPGLNKAEVSVVEVPKHNYVGSDILTQAVDVATKRYANKTLRYNNYGAQFEYMISRKSLRYAANHSSKSDNIGVHAAVMDILDTVIGESIEVMEHADVNKVDGKRSEDYGYKSDTLMHRFVGAVKIDGQVYRVITTIKEYATGHKPGHHTYEVTKIEVLDEKTPSTSNGTTLENSSPTWIAKLLKGTEIHNKSGEKILEESKNEDSKHNYRLREKPAPKKTRKAYKLLRVDEQGRPYALFIDANTPIRVGVWYDADSPNLSDLLKLDEGDYLIEADGKATHLNKKPTKKQVQDAAKAANGSRYMGVSHYADGGKKVFNYGINGSGGVSAFAMRPGWHITNAPSARHIGERVDKIVTYRRPYERWFEVEYAADVDYNAEAAASSSLAGGIDSHIPEDGWYEFQTNTNANPNQTWIISGAIKIGRSLSEAEAASISESLGIERDLPYKNGIKNFDEGVPEANDEVSVSEMERRATELGELLHTPIRIVRDRNTLANERDRKAKGWYDRGTGEIVVVIENNDDIADVERTVLHEIVAHKGLRQIFGEDFDNFLDNVFANVTDEVRAQIVELAKKHGWDFREATEEYLASLAETTNFEEAEKQSWFVKVWNVIKESFIAMLRKKGVTLNKRLGDNELRYMLWRSYQMQKCGDLVGEAENILKQDKLGVSRYSQKHYRAGDSSMRDRVNARDRYERRVQRGWYQTKEALQDSMLGLREAMDAIMRAEGSKMNIEDIDGFENAYLGENRLSSVNQAEAEAMGRLLFKPMLAEIAKLAKTERQRNRLTEYMMAKHGLERNEVMARRDAVREMADSDEYAAMKVAEAALKADPTDADLQDAFSRAQQDYEDTLYQKFEELRERDYAGLTALTGEDDVKAAEHIARIMVQDYEADHDTSDLWDRVNAVSDAILSKTYECGLISKETYEMIMDMYEYYIPLRGFDETTSREAYAYLDHNNSGFNAPIKAAKGRTSKADDPIAQLQSMAESAIMQGNRNKLVKQKFLNFVLNHPSDLASVSDLWLQYNKVTDEWQPVFPDNIESDDDAATVEQKMLDFEQKMQQLAESEPDVYKKAKENSDIPYRVVETRDARQHQVIVKRGGVDYIITINGNPRAAQALNGQTNPDNDLTGAIGAVMKVAMRINRQLSAFYTTRNPDFVVSNFIRDMIYSNTMVWVKERPGYALRFHRNFAMVNPALLRWLYAKYTNGTLKMTDETEKMFYQFMMNGGETGYVQTRDIEAHKTQIKREIKRTGKKISIEKAWSIFGEYCDKYNRAVENCARFAAFMTSRQIGRTIDRAIYDAKEISVNFNKKGSGAKYHEANGQTRIGRNAAIISGLGRSLYVFWNASIQGSSNIGRQMKRHPIKAMTGLATMFTLGALVAAIGGDGDDEDKNSYYNLPEYVRRSNILFRSGDTWVAIPLPIEYRAVYGMGELMMSTMSGKEQYTDAELASKITAQMSQVLPLDFMEGGGGVNAFIPSAAKPTAEAYFIEKSWTGMPLYNDTPWNKYDPQWTKAYSSANKYIVGMTATLNEWTGGDQYTRGSIDLNPAKIEYFLTSTFGGVATTIDKLVKMGETASGEREYNPQNFLLLNRVLKSGDERTENRAVNKDFLRIKDEHDELKNRLKRYESDTERGIFDYAEKISTIELSPEYQRYEIFEKYRIEIDAINKQLKEPELTDEERSELEAELMQIKRTVVEECKGARWSN